MDFLENFSSLDSAVGCILNFVIKYLGEIETAFENTLACLSGVQMGSNEKKLEVKNLVTHSLL